jgi:hypothetical protein
VEVAQDVRQGDDEGPGRQRRQQRADARDEQDGPPIGVLRLAGGVDTGGWGEALERASDAGKVHPATISTFPFT